MNPRTFGLIALCVLIGVLVGVGVAAPSFIALRNACTAGNVVHHSGTVPDGYLRGAFDRYAHLPDRIQP